LSPSLVRLVDEVCDRFEAAWQAGQRPQLEDFVRGTVTLVQSTLLQELLAMGLAYRRRSGEQPDAEEYRRRFPDHVETISAVFSEQALAGSPASPPDLSDGKDSAPSTGPETVNGAHAADSRPGQAAPASGPASDVTPAELPTIPGHELLGVLGVGGMGVVYKARHLRLKRLVAVKMVLAGTHATPDQLARFRSEAEAVARLQHPNIVPIHESGEADGKPYFSLEFLEGGRLDKKLDGTPLPDREAAALVETLARAIHHAQSQGIIHRDLKPANVLLTAEGTAKITDFGLAKIVTGDGGGQTQTGAILGTPSYMAPEQAEGKGKTVGPAADVYALGAILYELLTGRPPFKAATPFDTILQVLTEEPVPPSRLQRKMPRDLETICLKCLEKAPRRRYADAAALAEDLRRFQAGEPILARPTPAWERGVKWAKRRPAAALALGATVVLLVGSLYYTGQLRSERKTAQEQRQLAVDSLGFSRSTLLTTQLQRAAAVFEHDPDRAVQLLEDGLACPPDLRYFTWGYSYRQCKGSRVTSKADPRAVSWPVSCVAFSPDGKTLAAVGQVRVVRLWDVASGKELPPLRVQPLVLVSTTLREMKINWNTAGSRFPHVGLQLGDAVAFSPDGKTLAASTGDNAVRVWDVSTGQQRVVLKWRASALVYSPDGKILAGGTIPHIKLWDIETGQESTVLNVESVILSLAFSPDSKLLAAASEGGKRRVWDLEAGQERVALAGHGFWVAFSPDGKTLPREGIPMALCCGMWPLGGRKLHSGEEVPSEISGVARSALTARQLRPASGLKNCLAATTASRRLGP
jgi:serine/threonine protein kinase